MVWHEWMIWGAKHGFRMRDQHSYSAGIGLIRLQIDKDKKIIKNYKISTKSYFSAKSKYQFQIFLIINLREWQKKLKYPCTGNILKKFYGTR